MFDWWFLVSDNFVDTDNIIQWDKKKNVPITDNSEYLLLIILIGCHKDLLNIEQANYFIVKENQFI